jgi:murein tripeptide amidase MpaA
VLKISDNVSTEEAEPNIFISGCHHAREWISVEIPLLFARHILENHGSEEQSTRIINEGQIYIMPIVNPDGLEYSIHTYRFWRKNRRYNGDLSWGVDPNRNYGFAWGYDDIGSSPEPDDAVYRGPYAFSEPETRAVRDFLLDHPPAGSLNFHNYSQLILYSWGYTAVPAPDDAEMETIARNMAELIYRVNGRTYLYGAGALAIYFTNGDTDDWIYGTFGTPSFTIELPPELFVQGGFFTSQEMINSAFSEMLPAMLYFCSHIIQTHPAGIKE